jgi:hypothetical protein
MITGDKLRLLQAQQGNLPCDSIIVTHFDYSDDLGFFGWDRFIYDIGRTRDGRAYRKRGPVREYIRNEILWRPTYATLDSWASVWRRHDRR